MDRDDPPRTSFFAPIAAHCAPEDVDDLVDVGVPPWSCPPQQVRPGVVALSAVLGRSASTVVLIEGARAYTEGVVLRIVVVVNDVSLAARRRVFEQLDITHGRGSLHLSLPEGGLRWGFESSDGRRTTTLDDSPWQEMPEGIDPTGWVPGHPVMEALSRPSVVAHTWSRDVWLWPLPPADTIRAVCAWPDRGISESDTIIDIAPLRAAAARAMPLWP